MNWFLFLAVLFTFLFVIYAVQSVNVLLYFVALKQRPKKQAHAAMPFISALLASIFWALV